MVQGIILFNVGGKEWTLDLSLGKGSVTEGQPDGVTPELTLTMTDDTFAKLVAGKLNPQQVRPCAATALCVRLVAAATEWTDDGEHKLQDCMSGLAFLPAATKGVLKRRRGNGLLGPSHSCARGKQQLVCACRLLSSGS
jgi:SCP-2 sterol transfer family